MLDNFSVYMCVGAHKCMHRHSPRVSLRLHCTSSIPTRSPHSAAVLVGFCAYVFVCVQETERECVSVSLCVCVCERVSG